MKNADAIYPCPAPVLIDRDFAERDLQDIQDEALFFLPYIAKEGPVVTTNYDKVLERIYREQNDSFNDNDIILGARPTAFTRGTHGKEHLLLKIHGTVGERQNRILSGDQYQEHYGHVDSYDSKSPLPTLLKQLFRSCDLLFLGCSLENDRTMKILYDVFLEDNNLRHYAILETPENDFEKKKIFLSERGIRPIWYPHGQYDLIRDALLYIIRNRPHS